MDAWECREALELADRNVAAERAQGEAAVQLLREALFGPVPDDWEERALKVVES